MKPQTALTVFTFYATVCCGQSNVVYYGANSNSLDVVFVDTNLNASVRSNIVADLNICLQKWGKKGELCLWDNEDTAGYLYIGSACPSYPEGIKFPKSVVSNGVSGVALQIPKELSDAYTNAFAFAAAHSNEVKAAYEFVKFVSSTNFHSVTPQQISDYALYNQLPPRGYELGFHDITNELRYVTFYTPSVLGFHHSPQGSAATVPSPERTAHTGAGRRPTPVADNDMQAESLLSGLRGGAP